MTLSGFDFSDSLIRDLLKTGRSPGDHLEQFAVHAFRVLFSAQDPRGDAESPALVDAWIARLQPDPENQVKSAGERIFSHVRDIEDGPFVHPLVQAWMLEYEAMHAGLPDAVSTIIARALFSCHMVRKGYVIFRFLPLAIIQVESGIRPLARQSFADFARDRAEIISTALEKLERRAAPESEIDALAHWPVMREGLNHRQQALVAHALRNPRHEYTLDLHRRTHGIAYATARADLYALHDRGFLASRKRRKAWVFIAPSNLGEILDRAEIRSPAREAAEALRSAGSVPAEEPDNKKWYFW